MTNAARVVGGGVERTARSGPASVLAVLLAAALFADVPGLFTRGDVLRGPVVLFLAAAAAALGALLPARRLSPGRTVLLLLPLAIPLLGLLPPRPDAAAWSRLSAPWVGVAALAWGLARVRRGAADADRAGRWLVVAGAGVGVWVLVDAILRGGVGVGPFGRPGIAGPVLAALAVAAGVRPLPGRPWWWRAAGVALPLAGLVTTGSRTGMVAFVLGLLLAGALAARGRAALLLRGGLVATAALLVLVFAAAASGRGDVPGSRETVRVRTGLWAGAIRLVAERPLVGQGLGRFDPEILRVRDRTEARISRGRRPGTAHDDVLNAAAEGGVPAGLLLLAWIVGILLVGLGVTRGETPGSAPRRAAAADGGLVATLLVASLGECILLDPAGTLLVAVGAAGLLSRDAPRPAPRGLVAPLIGLALAVLALASGSVLGRDLVADQFLERYHGALRHPLMPVDAVMHARNDLENGALSWRPDLAEAWYRLGVHHGRHDAEKAREAYDRALAIDDGMTEARLDLSSIALLEGKRDEAQRILEEARRHDPTRFEIPIRMGHLALGTEPVPGEPPGDDYQPIRALRHYNEARALDPGRFELRVANARMARREGDLARAGRLLQQALQEVAPAAAKALAAPPADDPRLPEAAARDWVVRQANTLNLLARHPETAEILLESFRLAEREHEAPAAWVAGLLELALSVDPRLGGTVRSEAERFRYLGGRRVIEAREAVGATGARPDYSSAERALDAAALRWAGLLRAGLLDPGKLLDDALEAANARAFRVAYARFRALLSWATTRPAESGPDDAARLDRLADLYVEAAKAARRFDGDLSTTLYARGHAAAGFAFLARGEWAKARELLGRAADEAPGAADIRLGLARVGVAEDRLDDAETRLLEALDLAPALADRLRTDPAFQALRDRPRVAAALR